MRLARLCAAVVPVLLVGIDGGAHAQRAHVPRRVEKPAATSSPRGATAGPATDGGTAAAPASTAAAPTDAKPADTKASDAKPYDPQLLRLAEILGVLTYLGALCDEPGAEGWRQRMQALLDVEGQPALRRDRLAGAFNEGLRGYELSYHSCTVNARAVIARFLAEGSRLAQDVENRYRAS